MNARSMSGWPLPWMQDAMVLWAAWALLVDICHIAALTGQCPQLSTIHTFFLIPSFLMSRGVPYGVLSRHAVVLAYRDIHPTAPQYAVIQNV